MNNVHFSSKTDLWSTPQDLFDSLNAEWHFTLDVCATPENAKCKKFYTPDMDGLKQDWKDNICWMNPPYGKDRSLFPLKQLKRAHFLITALSKENGFFRNSSIPNSPRKRGFNVAHGEIGLGLFNDQKRMNKAQNRNDIIPINHPFPSDTFIELSGLLAINCANFESSFQELNSRFVNHLNFNIDTINIADLRRLTFSPSFTLMDAYTTFAINNPSAPCYDIFIHDLIIPLVRGFIKWNKTAIAGIGKWIKKAYESTFMNWQHNGTTVVCLLPVRTDTSWFQDYCMKASEIRFIRGRLKFGDSKNSAPFPSCIVVFTPRKSE